MLERKQLLSEIASNKSDKEKLSQILETVRGLAFFDLAYFIQGLIEKINKQYELAGECFKKALENSSEDINMLSLIADGCFDIGRYDESIAILLKCLELDKEKKETYLYKHRIGCAYVKLRKYEEAITYFAKAIEENSNYFPSYYHICMCASMLKKIEILRNYSEIAYAKFKDIENAKERLSYLVISVGKFYYDKEEHELAIQYLDKAISLNKDPAFYANKGLCFTKLSQYDNAFNAYEVALSIDPNHAFTFYDRALTFRQLNKTQDVIKNLIEAIKRDNTFFERAKIDDFLSFLGASKCNNAEEFLQFLTSKLMEKVSN